MPQLPARFNNRQNRRNIMQFVAAGLGRASPPYVSIKGNQFTLVDSNGEEVPVETKHLDCVIFDVNLDVAVQRVYWAEAYNPNGEAVQPTCFSDNGVGASSQAQNPQSSSCSLCEMNKWGSATSKITGKGVKACSVIKKVAVIPVEGQIGPDGMTYVPRSIQAFPFLLRVPVMSHDNLRAYSAKFQNQDFDISEVVTRITFVQGQVGQLDFAPAGLTDDVTEKSVQQFLDQKLTDGLVGRGDVPVGQQQLGQQGNMNIALQQAGQGNYIAPPGPTQAPQTMQEPPKAKGGRPKKTAPEAPNGQPQGGLPPFLQGAQTPASHGIVQQAPAPSAELSGALASVFDLKT